MKSSLHLIRRVSFCKRLAIRRQLSSWLKTGEEFKISAPVEKLFADSKVQGLLNKLTGVSFEKVFEPRPQENPENPFYRLMTSEELEKMNEEANEAASLRLQMPPIVESQATEGRVISVDDEISGFDSAKYVFTDITYEIHDKDRIVAVREPDGTLRTGSSEERERMIRLYFPKEHRSVHIPEVFFEPHLENVLNLHRHVHILDWCCQFFEPYDPEFARVCTSVFEHANKNNLFHLFWSTRHCGNMIFYLVINKNIDNYLLHLADNQKTGEMRDIVILYNLCHKDSLCAEMISDSDSDWQIVKKYIENDARNRNALEHSLLQFAQENEENRIAN